MGPFQGDATFPHWHRFNNQRLHPTDMHSYNILFLCTDNSTRSIMAEALASIESRGRIVGYSAGPHPVETVNPFAIEMIRPLGYSIETLRPKNWEEFAAADAPQMDFVITVCDEVADESCPMWPGKPLTAHWGCQDPAAVSGSDEKKRQAFKDVFYGLQRRLKILLALPLERLDRTSLLEELTHMPQVQRRLSRPASPENADNIAPRV